MLDLPPMHLFDLPNEILVATLSLLRTSELLPLTEVSQRFHYLSLRILHYRLLLAASNSLYQIILEAYLPSRRYTRPYLYCTYLGTDGLSSSIEGEGSMYADCKDEKGNEIFGGRLAKLGALYSRFRPEYPGVQGQMPVRRIAGAAPNMQSNTSGLQTDWYSAPGHDTAIGSAESSGLQNNTSAEAEIDEGEHPNSNDIVQSDMLIVQQGPLPQSQPIWSDFGDGGSKKIIYDFHFDEDELFGQFCLAASLVRMGPRRGVFLSYLHLCTDRQGVMRVWRQWLIEKARELALKEKDPNQQQGDQLKRTPTMLKAEDIALDPNILWTDHKRNMGLRVLVREKPVEGVPMRGPHEDKDDIPLSFSIEIQEFIIRTSRLMLAVEESQEAQTKPGNALIFGNFAVASP